MLWLMGKQMRKELALIASLVVVAGAASAEEFALVTGNEYAPYTDQGLPEGGLATEITKAAFAKEGHTLKIDFAPWKRGFEISAKGDVAGTFPYVVSEERQKQFVYSTAMLSLTQDLLANPGAGISSVDPAALKGKRICMPLGYSTIKTIQPLVDSKEIARSELPDMKSCMQHVATGRSDFLIIDRMSGSIAMAEAKQAESAFKRVPVDATTNTLHFIVGRSRPDADKIIGIFNAGFEKLKSSGELTKIIQKHVPGYAG